MGVGVGWGTSGVVTCSARCPPSEEIRVPFAHLELGLFLLRLFHARLFVLLVEERVPLWDAVRAVFAERPIVLSNASFVAQLVALAEREGLAY